MGLFTIVTLLITPMNLQVGWAEDAGACIRLSQIQRNLKLKLVQRQKELRRMDGPGFRA